MRNNGIACNTITYNTMLDACAKCSSMEKAAMLLEDMRETKIEPATRSLMERCCFRCDGGLYNRSNKQRCCCRVDYGKRSYRGDASTLTEFTVSFLELFYSNYMQCNGSMTRCKRRDE